MAYLKKKHPADFAHVVAVLTYRRAGKYNDVPVIPIACSPGDDIGLSLEKTASGLCVVKSLAANGPLATNSSRLAVGDLVVSLNGRKTANLALKEANALLISDPNLPESTLTISARSAASAPSSVNAPPAHWAGPTGAKAEAVLMILKKKMAVKKSASKLVDLVNEIALVVLHAATLWSFTYRVATWPKTVDLCNPADPTVDISACSDKWEQCEADKNGNCQELWDPNDKRFITSHISFDSSLSDEQRIQCWCGCIYLSRFTFVVDIRG